MLRRVVSFSTAVAAAVVATLFTLMLKNIPHYVQIEIGCPLFGCENFWSIRYCIDIADVIWSVG